MNIWILALVYAIPGGCPLPPGGPYDGVDAEGTHVISHLQEIHEGNGCMVHTYRADPVFYHSETECLLVASTLYTPDRYPGQAYFMDPRWRCVEAE